MITIPRPRGAIAAIPVAVLAAAAALVTAAGCGPAPTATRTGTSPPAHAATMMVKAYFHKGAAGDPRQVAPVARQVPRSSAVAAAALNQLLAGPVTAERHAGYWSFFCGRTAHMLRSVNIAHGTARADFRDFSGIIPNASSSFGSTALLAELDATLRQFPGVRSTVYSFNGDPVAFYEWLQMPPPGRPHPAWTAGAVAQARAYLRAVAGMPGLTAAAARVTGTGLAEVSLHSDSRTGPVTTVTLRRHGPLWVPTGARTPAIRLAEPSPGQAVTSPVTVSGRSVTFEGQLSTRVVRSAGGHVTVLGSSNSVLGGSTGMAPFRGQVSLTRPASGSGTVWVVLTYQSAKTGAIAGATAVQVRYGGSAAPPRIGRVLVTSGQPVKNGWLTLPAGAGTVTVAARTTGAAHVRLYLIPTGTGTGSLRELIGEGTPVNGEVTVTWQYQDEPLLAHLSVVAAGPGGRAERTPFNVMHP